MSLHPHRFVTALVATLLITTGVSLGGGPVNTDQTGLALSGYDPVAYFTVGEPTKGDFQITAEHGGATYRFASEQNRRQFLQNPDRYVPEYGGYCAYGVAVNAQFTADPTIWKIVDGKLYLNLDENIAKKFNQDIAGHIEKANANWPELAGAGVRDVNVDSTGLALHGYDPVAYFTQGKAAKGDFQITAEHDAATYRFVTEQNREKFIANPARYEPQFGGYCAYGVAVGGKFTAYPTVWKIVDGKLYLNLDERIAEKFNEDVEGYLAKARENWPELAGSSGK